MAILDRHKSLHNIRYQKCPEAALDTSPTLQPAKLGGAKQARRWQRRRLRDLARRILARHYSTPNHSDECPFQETKCPFEQIRKDWYDGHADGLARRPAQPGTRDRLSYTSGWIEGAATRTINYTEDKERPTPNEHRQPNAQTPQH